VNISTRLKVQTGDNVLIGGFVIQGTSPRKVIIRATGPSLTNFGVSGALQDPTLELHDSTGAMIASNDNWQTSQGSDISSSGHAPTDTRESAIVATLQPGPYTAIVRGAGNSTGVALVEVYTLDTSTTTQLVNISTRGKVETGDNVMIGGFVVQGPSPIKVIVRATGPSLTNFGVSGALQDPTLELHDSSGAMIASNDNWQSSQASDISSSGHAPSDTRESAIVATLQPGSYTAIVRGAGNSTGVALVEVYQLP
jgi:hypothetical protein